MDASFLVFVFLLGLCVGSFINVVIYRTWHGISPYKGRSFCDNCGRQLSWYDNVPVISYVLLRGQCRTCKKKIDWSYPVVELVTGLLFVWWGTLGFAFFRLSSFPLKWVQPTYWLLIGLILIIVFFADLIYGIIPDLAVAAMSIISLVYRYILVTHGAMQKEDFWWAIAAALVAGGIFWGLHIVTKGKGMGFGDVKLAAVMGLILGHPRTWIALFLAFVIGAIVASGMLIMGKKKFKQTVPFGPFLIIGLCLALVWGDRLWSWYFGMLK